MAELVDPEKLISVAQAAKEYGYSPNYFAALATQKKIKAWRIGKTWATTREIVEDYIRVAPPAGRPKQKDTQKKHKTSTKK